MNRPNIQKPDYFEHLPPENKYYLDWLLAIDGNMKQDIFDNMCRYSTDDLRRDAKETAIHFKRMLVPFAEHELTVNAQKERREQKARLKEERSRIKLARVEFVVIDGKLHRVEYWGPHGIHDGNPKHVRPPIPCGKRVMIRGKQRTSALVVHEILTGEKLAKRPDKRIRKQYRARIYIHGRLTHIGYYVTPEERDAVQAMAKIGIYPEGFEVRP